MRTELKGNKTRKIGDEMNQFACVARTTQTLWSTKNNISSAMIFIIYIHRMKRNVGKDIYPSNETSFQININLIKIACYVYMGFVLCGGLAG